MNTTTETPPIADGEWRFDRIKKEDLWAACIWEYCREHFSGLSKREISLARKRGHHTQSDRGATLGVAIACDEFPHTPWLSLPEKVRGELARRWKKSPGDIEDYNWLEYADGKSADERRKVLRKLGIVVFDLGAPPSDAPTMQRRLNPKALTLPTRADLLRKFEAWLDENPTWWHGRGKAGKATGPAGKRTPDQGLRLLAYSRLRRRFKDDGKVHAFVKRIPQSAGWMGVAISPERARKLPKEARDWQRLICQV